MLPPVDKYRAPFIEPLGHVVLWAARAEAAWVDLLATIMDGVETAPLDKLRAEASRLVSPWKHDEVLQILVSLAEGAVQAKKLARTHDRLRLKRNRVVHDVAAVLIAPDDEDPTKGRVAVGFVQQPRVRHGSAPSQVVLQTDLQEVADLAHALHELALDVEQLAWTIQWGRNDT